MGIHKIPTKNQEPAPDLLKEETAQGGVLTRFTNSILARVRQARSAGSEGIDRRTFLASAVAAPAAATEAVSEAVDLPRKVTQALADAIFQNDKEVLSLDEFEKRLRKAVNQYALENFHTVASDFMILLGDKLHGHEPLSEEEKADAQELYEDISKTVAIQMRTDVANDPMNKADAMSQALGLAGDVVGSATLVRAIVEWASGKQVDFRYGIALAGSLALKYSAANPEKRHHLLEEWGGGTQSFIQMLILGSLFKGVAYSGVDFKKFSYEELIHMFMTHSHAVAPFITTYGGSLMTSPIMKDLHRRWGEMGMTQEDIDNKSYSMFVHNPNFSGALGVGDYPFMRVWQELKANGTGEKLKKLFSWQWGFGEEGVSDEWVLSMVYQMYQCAPPDIKNPLKRAQWGIQTLIKPSNVINSVKTFTDIAPISAFKGLAVQAKEAVDSYHSGNGGEGLTASQALGKFGREIFDAMVPVGRDGATTWKILQDSLVTGDKKSLATLAIRGLFPQNDIIRVFEDIYENEVATQEDLQTIGREIREEAQHFDKVMAAKYPQVRNPYSMYDVVDAALLSVAPEDGMTYATIADKLIPRVQEECAKADPQGHLGLAREALLLIKKGLYQCSLDSNKFMPALSEKLTPNLEHLDEDWDLEVPEKSLDHIKKGLSSRTKAKQAQFKVKHGVARPINLEAIVEKALKDSQGVDGQNFHNLYSQIAANAIHSLNEADPQNVFNAMANARNIVVSVLDKKKDSVENLDEIKQALIQEAARLDAKLKATVPSIESLKGYPSFEETFTEALKYIDESKYNLSSQKANVLISAIKHQMDVSDPEGHFNTNIQVLGMVKESVGHQAASVAQSKNGDEEHHERAHWEHEFFATFDYVSDITDGQVPSSLDQWQKMFLENLPKEVRIELADLLSKGRSEEVAAKVSGYLAQRVVKDVEQSPNMWLELDTDNPVEMFTQFAERLKNVFGKSMVFFFGPHNSAERLGPLFGSAIAEMVAVLPFQIAAIAPMVDMMSRLDYLMPGVRSKVWYSAAVCYALSGVAENYTGFSVGVGMGKKLFGPDLGKDPATIEIDDKDLKPFFAVLYAVSIAGGMSNLLGDYGPHQALLSQVADKKRQFPSVWPSAKNNVKAGAPMNAWIAYQLHSVSESLAAQIEGIKKGDKSGSFSAKALEKVAHDMAEKLIEMAKEKWNGEPMPEKAAEMVEKLERFLAGEAPELNQTSFKAAKAA